MIGASLLLAAMVASGPNLGAGISPAVVSGPANSQAVFTITNAGNISESIIVHVTEMRPVKGHPGQWVPYDGYDHAKVSNPTFNLKKGQHRTVTVTINSPDKYQHQLAVFAESSVAGTPSGMARIHASVAARYVINPDGNLAPNAPKAVSVPRTAKPSSTLPVVPIAGGIVLAAILGLCAAIWRHRRKRRTQPTTDNPYGFIS
jgi:hypothetical protein